MVEQTAQAVCNNVPVNIAVDWGTGGLIAEPVSQGGGEKCVCPPPSWWFIRNRQLILTRLPI